MAHEAKIERTRNLSNDVHNYSVTVGSAVAVTLVPAEDIEKFQNSRRLSITVSNANNQGCWVRKYAAGLDNLKVGIYIPPLGARQIMQPDNIFIGEISVIMASGGSKTIIAEEY